MYTENDYLNYTDLNSVETKIKELYTYYNLSYTPKTWQINEYMFIDDVKRIENAIDKMGNYFNYPQGYIETKKWGAYGTISYIDINRWLHNIDLLRNSEFNPLVPSETLYPRDGFIICDTDIYCGTNVISNPLVPTNNKESD